MKNKPPGATAARREGRKPLAQVMYSFSTYLSMS
jgi:hypothetical protein